MATLTEAAYYSRKTINYAAIGVVVFLVLRMIFGAFVSYIRTAFPPAFRPDNRLGKLPRIVFPESASPSADIVFTLQTVDGNVPEATTAARVYFMPKNRSDLFTLSRAQTLAGRMNFTTTPTQLTDTLYLWRDLKSPLRSIEIDILSSQFSLNYLFPHDLTLFSERNIPSPQEALAEGQKFFQVASVPFSDVDVVNGKVQYLKLVSNKLENASSQSTADAVKIDYFRRAITGFPLVTDNFNDGISTLILSGSKRSDRRVLYAKYKNWQIDYATSGVYALKKSTTAWTEFLEGKGYIASLPNNIGNEIKITNIFVAYYDGTPAQYYLQPVFVIVGEGGFVAYVPAVAPPWTE